VYEQSRAKGKVLPRKQSKGLLLVKNRGDRLSRRPRPTKEEAGTKKAMEKTAVDEDEKGYSMAPSSLKLEGGRQPRVMKKRLNINACLAHSYVKNLGRLAKGWRLAVPLPRQ